MLWRTRPLRLDAAAEQFEPGHEERVVMYDDADTDLAVGAETSIAPLVSTAAKHLRGFIGVWRIDLPALPPYATGV